MAKKAGVELDWEMLGDKDLKKSFQALGAADQQKATKLAAKRSLRPTEKAIKGAAPKASGRLAANIKTLMMSAGKGRGLIGARVVTPPPKVLGIAPSAKGYYPSAMEFGYKHNGYVIDPDTKRRVFIPALKGKPMPGRPFIRRVFEAAKPAMKLRFVGMLWNVIEAIAKRNAKKAGGG